VTSISALRVVVDHRYSITQRVIDVTVTTFKKQEPFLLHLKLKHKYSISNASLQLMTSCKMQKPLGQLVLLLKLNQPNEIDGPI